MYLLPLVSQSFFKIMIKDNHNRPIKKVIKDDILFFRILGIVHFFLWLDTLKM